MNLKQRFSFEPDTLTYAATALKNRLDDTVILYTLEECKPIPVDFIALLIDSLQNLHEFRKELAACPARVSQEKFADLEHRLFQPFMQDLLPVIELSNDDMLSGEYQLMNYDYRHMLIRDLSHDVLLRGKFPMAGAMACLQYLHEDILDRLYAHGADDDLVEPYLSFPRI